MVLDLLQIHGITPKKKAGTHGGEYASPCPTCGGRDRFLCWPAQGERGTWWCRGCDKGGDAIEFLRVFDDLSFAEACERLGVSREYQRKPLAVPKARGSSEAFTPKNYAAPEQKWQDKATELLTYAHKQLLANPTELARLDARGLPREAVKRFCLGWLPGERNKNTGQVRDCYYRSRAAWGLPEVLNAKGKPKNLWIPRGLVIPAMGRDGEVLRLRIRRLDADRERFLPDMKFAVIPGSFMGPLLLTPACGARAFVVQESELDGMACLFAAERADLQVGSLSVGTNRGKPDAAAHAMLAESVAILVALDFDPPDAKGNRPGAQGFAWWHGQYRQAERWPSAMGKDVGEGVSQGMDLAAWLRAGLPPVLARRGRPMPAVAPFRPESPAKAMPVGPLTFGLSALGQGGRKTTPALGNANGVDALAEMRPAWMRPCIPGESLDDARERRCALARCATVFLRQPGTSDAAWAVRRYCSAECFSGKPRFPVRDAAACSSFSISPEGVSPDGIEEVRVPPESSNSPGGPDAVTSDQENSQPS